MAETIYRSAAGRRALERCYDVAVERLEVEPEERTIETRYGATHVLLAGPEDAQPVFVFHDSRENPLGDGGEQLHEWIYDLESWRAQHGLEGGETNRDDEIFAESVENVGAIVMGRRMFDNGEGPWGEEPFEGHWGDEPPFGVPVFVLTHHARDPLELGATTFTFVTDGVEVAVERAREAADGADISVAGGARTIQQCLEDGLLDELEIHLVPVLLGDGVGLFEPSDHDETDLERTRVVESPDVTHLRFRIDS